MEAMTENSLQFNIIRNSNKMNESWEQSHVNGRKRIILYTEKAPFLLTLFLVGQE